MINRGAVRAIYAHEMTRFFRTVWQSIASPVLSTVLYFVVFGAAIGGRIQAVEGIPYGAFIVPGLMLLTVLQQSVSNSAFGISPTASITSSGGVLSTFRNCPKSSCSAEQYTSIAVSNIRSDFVQPVSFNC